MVNNIPKSDWKNNLAGLKLTKSIPLKILGILLLWMVTMTSINSVSPKIITALEKVKKKTWEITELSKKGKWRRVRHSSRLQANFKYPEWELVSPKRTTINLKRNFNTKKLKKSIIKKLIKLWVKEKIATNATNALVKITVGTQKKYRIKKRHTKRYIYTSQYIDSNIFSWTGFFISPNIIATAAHNLRDRKTGKGEMFYGIHWLNWKNYTSQAIYIWKGEDIAFIIVNGKSKNYIDIFQKDDSKDNQNIISLWLSSIANNQNITVGKFDKINVWNDLKQVFKNRPKFSPFKKLKRLAIKYKSQTVDSDNDGIPLGKDYFKITNHLLPWDSGWVMIDTTGKVQCLLTMIGYCEPLQDIKKVYENFKKQSNWKWYTIIEN